MHKELSFGPESGSTQPVSAFEQRLDYRLVQGGIVTDPSLLLSDDQRQNQYDQLIAMTGNTPFTQYQNDNGLILMKRLSQNLSECHYDLTYLQTLHKLEAAGVIWPSNRNGEHAGQRVELIELTSGSAGISFGFVTKVMGFEGTLYVPSEIEEPRIHPMRAMGLNVEITPPGYVKAASEKLSARIQELTDDGYERVRYEKDGDRSVVLEKGDHRVCIVNHSENETTIHAFEQVGQEMANYLPEDISPNYLILIIGNYTSATGIGKIMRGKYPNIKIIGLESTENPNWFTERYPGKYEELYGHKPTFSPTRIYGTSQRGVRLYFANPELFDDIRLFDPDDAIKFQHRYNQGLPSIETIGRSTGAVLMTAEALTEHDQGSIVMTINYDKGDRYDTFVSANTEQSPDHDNSTEPTSIQPFGYHQPQLASLEGIPHSLSEAYSQV